jgi:hypothetical protein
MWPKRKGNPLAAAFLPPAGGTSHVLIEVRTIISYNNQTLAASF